MSEYVRTYSELIKLPTFKERFEYCNLHGLVGDETFGGSRYLNQQLYHLPYYKEFRQKIILRDFGLDLATPDYPIPGKIIVHHLNPLSISDVYNMDPCCMDPENVICVSLNTHNAIHYGDISLLTTEPIERRPGDQCPWLK